MSYVARQQITAKIPAPLLTEALDDDGDGAEDAGLLDQIIANASQAVHGFLSGLFTVPFPDPAPTAVQQAAFIFTLEEIYARRSERDEKNPWRDQADFWRERLQQIGDRKLPLDAAAIKAVVPGAVITDTISVDGSST